MGNYRISRQLASRGLLSDAWAGLADDGRAVTVLRRKDPWARAASFAEQFTPWQRGWQSLRQAEGVVPLFEVGLAEGAVCVVQEFVEGEPLRLALTSGATPPGKLPLSIMETVAVVLQAARGLHALAQLSLVHGDVSASTLLLGADGTARLEAIGVAAAHGPDATLGPARSELLALSPEEASGERAPTTDVFRLGLLWLELLTGKPAFGGSSYAEVKARFEQFPGVTPGHFSAFPQPVATLLAMMLAKAPGARPAVTDVVMLLEQVTAAVGVLDPASTLAHAFARLFPTRALTRPQLDGGAPLTVTPTGDGTVKLARIITKKVSADDVAAAKALESKDAARQAAREWSLKHARDDDNPKDFALGATLIELQKLRVEQVEAALHHAQSLGATLFDSLLALDTIDEDEVLPVAAGLLRQAFLTGPQLLELKLGAAQAALLPRDAADDWQVFPIKVEAGALVVATLDPARGDVLDALKQRAKVRAVNGVRATARTIAEGFSRVYDGKTSAPEWAGRSVVGAQAQSQSFELDVPSELPPPSAPRLSLSASGALEPEGAQTAGFPSLTFSDGTLGAQHAAPSPYAQPAPVAQHAAPSPYAAPTPFAQNAAFAPVAAATPYAPPAPVPPLRPAPPVFELSGSLDVASRLFDALLSVMGDRGLEASAMIALVRSVAKQGGATGGPLDQVRLSVSAVVIASLLEGKRAFEIPSRPAVAMCLGPHWKDFEEFVRPLLDGDESLPSDPRGVVLSLCFEIANSVGAVPKGLGEATQAIDSLRSRYPLAALAALEIVLASH
jgi:hypothetical protein